MSMRFKQFCAIAFDVYTSSDMKFISVSTLLALLQCCYLVLAKAPSSSSDISFELPDITYDLETDEGSFQLRAYKSIKTTGILEEIRGGDVTRVSELRWVSVGRPIPVLMRSISGSNEKQLFHWDNDGFHIYFQMLTKNHIHILAEAASFKYRVNVTDNQVNHLILSSFECSFSLHDKSNNKHLVKGTVRNFVSFPLKMLFSAPPNSIERKVVLSRLQQKKSTTGIELMCTMASNGKKINTNTLRITSKQSDEYGLAEKLFGPSSKEEDAVYVTRQQMSDLSRELYATLNIVEDYDMAESQFSEAFIQDFIGQTAKTAFSFVPIDQALESLSKYAVDFSSDLDPDQIKRDLGTVLRVEKNGKKSHIVASAEYLKTEEDGFKLDLGGSATVAGLAAPSVNFGVDNSDSSHNQGKSLRDQLKELNLASQNEIKWEIEGNRVLPKSVKVARLLRANFQKTLKFSRVKIQKLEAPFIDTFSVNTARAKATKPLLDQLVTRVDELSTRLNQLSDSLRDNVKKLSYQIDVRVTHSVLLNNTVSKLDGELKELSKRALKWCRICTEDRSTIFSGTNTKCTDWINTNNRSKIRTGSKIKIECVPS